MENTGEPDPERRHFSSFSPTASTDKNRPFWPLDAKKEMDIALLQYQNKKLRERLEAQKAERTALEKKLSQLMEKQQAYDETLAAVNRAWDELIHGLESCSSAGNLINDGQEANKQLIPKALSPRADAFLTRLLGTQSTSASNHMEQIGRETSTSDEKSK